MKVEDKLPITFNLLLPWWYSCVGSELYSLLSFLRFPLPLVICYYLNKFNLTPFFLKKEVDKISY